jgi:hypothetical protein
MCARWASSGSRYSRFDGGAYRHGSNGAECCRAGGLAFLAEVQRFTATAGKVGCPVDDDDGTNDHDDGLADLL